LVSLTEINVGENGLLKQEFGIFEKGDRKKPWTHILSYSRLPIIVLVTIRQRPGKQFHKNTKKTGGDNAYP
jgi:hypothetical protein